MKKLLFSAILLLFSTSFVFAQISVDGITWERDEPARKVHLCNENGKHMMYDWVPFQELKTSVGLCASYTYDAKTDTEIFQLNGKNSNRSEIRLVNEYEFGARQFEGYVTFNGPLDDESLMQIWGSAEGATQLMLRGYSDDGGILTVNCGSINRQRIMDHCYGREIKVNIIHLQENVGNKFMVYLNDQKVFEAPDNEKAVNNHNANYHKYGCYGTVKDGHENPKVIWRKVRHFKDKGGIMLEKSTQTVNFPEIPVKKVGDADFDPGVTLSSKLPVVYRSSDLKVATVTPEGKIHIVGPGTTLILAFNEGNGLYHPTNYLRELKVQE